MLSISMISPGLLATKQQKQNIYEPGINLSWNTTWDNLQYLKSEQDKLSKEK